MTDARPTSDATPATFPARRLRRMRRTPALRALVRENRVTADDLIALQFVVENPADAGPVRSMPGVERVTLDGCARVAERLAEAGVRAVMLFGLPATKDALGTAAYDPRGVVPRAVRAFKRATPDAVVMTDVCLCQYTDHGHCGPLDGDAVANDATLPLLARTAVAHADAGADVVAPSGMMDGMVAHIRAGLDAAGHHDRAILSYAVKYASAFYGPFRDAAHSTPTSGDRRSHQMDPANVEEALAEAAQDVAEGADALMVKPGMPYLDVVRAVKQAHPGLPLAAYQVSGEYAMVKAAAERGWVDGEAVMLESLLAFKRAGADLVLTYFAEAAARVLGGR